jgi:hypothetical protein
MAVFGGRRQDENLALPPGQHLTASFPVLSAGPNPSIDSEGWEFFTISGTGQIHRWRWDQILALRDQVVQVRHGLERHVIRHLIR